MKSDDAKNTLIKDFFSNIVPAGVMGWALAILTASYFGYAQSVDSAFISSLVTTVLASYGITRVQQKDSESKKASDEKKPGDGIK